MKNILQQEQEMFEEIGCCCDSCDKFPNCSPNELAKDFLASSNQRVHIATLEGVVEWAKKNKKGNIGTHICFPLTEITFTSEVDKKEICVHRHEVETYNLALDNLINYLQTQINKAKK